MPNRSIVVVGSSNTDMVVQSNTLPRPGETVTGGTFLLAAGGKGANQAVAAARLGGTVRFIAKVGADLFGEQALVGYEKEGIDTSLIVREAGHATGVALILVDQQGENLISVAPGANFHWNPQDISRIRPAVEQAGIVVLQLEIPPNVVLETARIAATAKVPVILDPAPAIELPRELFKSLTYIKPNEHEAERLSGVKVIDEATAAAAAERLLEMGVQTGVIITLGSRGALVLKRGEKSQLIAAPSVQAVDSTAAGDAFTGSLANELARGTDLAEAVRKSNFVAALSTTRLGAQPSLPTMDEVLALMNGRQT